MQELHDSEAEEDVAEMLLSLADAAMQSDTPDEDERGGGHMGPHLEDGRKVHAPAHHLPKLQVPCSCLAPCPAQW
jgi:hypothetical protein